MKQQYPFAPVTFVSRPEIFLICCFNRLKEIISFGPPFSSCNIGRTQIQSVTNGTIRFRYI